MLSATVQHTRGGQSGFSLIEALVSILILALGLLGTLGMIVNSLKLSSSSAYRTIASQQAYSMAEQVRGNPLALVVDAGNDSFDTYSTSASVTQGCLQTGGCVRANYVNTTVAMWRAQLATVLPGGSGTVCRDSSPAANAPTQVGSGTGAGTISAWNCDNTGDYVVKVCWNEQRISASSSTVGTGGLLCTWATI